MVRNITRRPTLRSTSIQESSSKSHQNLDCNTPGNCNISQENAIQTHKESSFNQNEDSSGKVNEENVAQKNLNTNDDNSTEQAVKEGEREGKGKSKSKNKTHLENSSLLNEIDQQTNSDISETVQVTAQSPSFNNPVDNENGNKLLSDASNCVQSVNCNVDNSNEDGTSTDNIGQTGNSQSGEVVESEQSSENLDKTKTVDSSSDVKVRSNSTDSVQTNESKKIRLRRNTVHGTDNSKYMHSSEQSSQENGKTESEFETAEEDRSATKKAPLMIKLDRNRYKTTTPKNQESGEDSTQSDGDTIKNDARTPPQPRTKKWTGVAQAKPLCKIDLETIKQFCGKVEVLDEKDVKMDLPRERARAVSESDKKIDRKVSIEYKEESERPDFKKQSSSNSSGDEAKEDNKNIIAFNRKISIVDDTASKLRPPPEPAKNPVSEVLYITNLVRPFTIKQLKEVLERTGKIRSDGFWTDRIKSKCYVRYHTKEEAETTRNALHGVHWPIGNGKQLMIEYATVEEMEKAQNPPSTTPPRADLPKDKIFQEKENKKSQILTQDPVKKRRISDDDPKESSRDKIKRKADGRVREWDIGKEDVHRKRSRSRSRSRGRGRSKDKHRDKSRGRDHSREKNRSRDRDKSRHKHSKRSPSADGYVSKKQKKVEEEVPQKLMDDLFLKTKATPSIYWQPLTPEEIATKQQQRLMRMEEHKRRMEVTARSRRDSGRGATFRRR